MGGTQFSKECEDCHKQIVMQKTDAGWKALNPDFTPHNCKGAKPAATSGSLPALKIIGKITEYTVTNVVIGEKQIFIPAERRNTIKAEHPAGVVVRAYYENGTLVNMERASSDEIEKFLQSEQPAPIVTKNPVPATPPAAPPQATRTSPENGAAPQKRKIPDTEMLLSMCSSADGYWRAKFYLELRRCEEIRNQAECKNWQEAIRLAIEYQKARPVETETVFDSAEKIYKFITEKIAGVQ